MSMTALARFGDEDELPNLKDDGGKCGLGLVWGMQSFPRGVQVVFNETLMLLTMMMRRRRRLMINSGK